MKDQGSHEAQSRECMCYHISFNWATQKNTDPVPEKKK